MDSDAECEAMEESSEEKRTYLGDWRSREVFSSRMLRVFCVVLRELAVLEVEDEVGASGGE